MDEWMGGWADGPCGDGVIRHDRTDRVRVTKVIYIHIYIFI